MAFSVDVASGTVQLNGASVAVSADTLDIDAADATDPRFDLIVVDGAGVLSVVDGTPDANPAYPAIPANRVVLAAVYVPANETAITDDYITDKRVIIAPLAVPHGSIMVWGGQIADLPDGWLLCNGASLLRASYPLLFAAIGTMHGAADGTHFNLPDLRDRFIVGATSDDSSVAKSNIQGSLQQSGGVTGHLHSAHTNLTHANGAVADHPTLAHSGVAVADHASIAALAHAGAAVATHASIAALAHANGDVADHASFALAALTHANMAVGAHGSISKVHGTAAGTVVSVASHAITQPDAHPTSVLSRPAAAHTVTQPDNHPSIAALSHTITQPNDHPSVAALAHTVTQPATHGVVTHAFTQPDVHTLSAHNTTTNVPSYYALAYMIAA